MSIQANSVLLLCIIIGQGLQKRYFKAWKVHKKDSLDLEEKEEKETEVKTSPPPAIEEVSKIIIIMMMLV